MAVRVQPAAGLRLDQIYRYGLDRWGEAQAERYLRGMFAAFDGIDSGRLRSRPIPAEFGVSGCFLRYQRHFIYWRRLADGDVGIVTVLHERMHQIDRLRDDFGP